MTSRSRFQYRMAQTALALAVLTVITVAIQIFLAGLALFDRATWWADHKTFGMMIGPIIILLVLAMLLARPSRALVGMSIALLVLYIVQVNLPNVGSGWVAALHPLVGGSLMALPMSLAQGSWKLIRARRASIGYASTATRQREPAATVR